MNEHEDALREAMHAHDPLAPTTADLRFRMPTRRRGSPWLAAVAAAAGVLAVVTIALVVSHLGNHRAPTPVAQHPSPPVAKNASPATVAGHPSRPVPPIRSCPAEMPTRIAATGDYWIPQPPKGIDAAKGFVPLDTPTHAVVCAYLPGNHGNLTGTRTLDGDLSTIPADLAWLPPTHPDKQPCAAYYALTDGDYYLMALSYPGGTMWVSVPGQHCNGASNGRFIAPNLRAQTDSAYRTGRWSQPPPLVIAGCPQSAGRLGQQDRFVPDHPVSVQLCRLGKHSRSVTATQDDLARLTAELNRLPTMPWGYTNQCGPSGGPPSASYVLTFGYRAGPPLQVEIQEGCRPEIDNGNLQADSASSVLPLVHQLLGPP
jgi:hypothetical protein